MSIEVENVFADLAAPPAYRQRSPLYFAWRRFLANKADRSLDTDGTYPGYLAEAYEVIARLEQRGYTVVPLAKEVINE